MAIDPDPDWFRNEFPLVNATNLIIGPWTKYAYARSRSPKIHLARYLRLVDGVIGRALSEATPENARNPSRVKHYSLQEIEIYWEYDCDSPIQFVIGALPKIRSIGSAIFEGNRDISDAHEISVGTEHQSPSIKAKIAKGTWLKLYAKTNRRVRFEILLEANIIGQTASGQTASTRAELCEKLDALTIYAAGKLNRVLPVVLAPPAPASTLSALRLLTEINRCSRDPYLAEAIVGALVGFDRLSLYNNSPFYDVVHDLKSAGVLRTVIPHIRNYVVTDGYRHALANLRKLVG